MEFLIQERIWMYKQRESGSSFNNDAFLRGVRYFIDSAISRGQIYDGNKIRCPCCRCKNRKFQEVDSAENHLYRYGFVNDYYNWTQHGEEIAEITYQDSNYTQNAASPALESDQLSNFEDYNYQIDSQFNNMVHDIAGPSQWGSVLHETPNEYASQFFDLMELCNKPVFEGCSTETVLSIAMKLLQTKVDHGLPEAAYDSLCDIIINLLDCENKMPKSFRQTKKLLSGLQMESIRIDVCIGGCMIYYGEDHDLRECRFCGESRFEESRHGRTSRIYQPIAKSQMFYLPIIPRLQRLFMIESTAAHMSWHADREIEDSIMIHPSDGESWKHFNNCYPDFAQESRNVRLGLCTDGFSPFGMSSKSYSCWPVMLTPYNLPPWMCMTTRFMWLTVLIPGPHSPKKRLDIFLKPLIDDMCTLWNNGVDTYDICTTKHFTLKAALMWTVSDFPAYGMLSGWSTAGRLACPYCMEDTKAFQLLHGRKCSHFDCHRRFLPREHPYRDNIQNFKRDRVEYDSPVPFRTGYDIFERVRLLKYIWEQSVNEKLDGFGIMHNWTKKSIFWNLPYWINVKLRHNLDVMHIEKNIFENLFNTIMNVKGKSKDNGIPCRKDVAIYCRRPELELKKVRGKYVASKAKYTLPIDHQLSVCHWIKGLKFPDGYSSRLGNHVDLNQRKLVGYKSHDAHVFLERLMPIAFRGLLPSHLWQAVSELCTFFRDICASSLDTERMLHWKHNIVETICKLEIFFPPSFFDSMEHLPIHVAEEILLGGPVHYRWMYPFERFIYRLKKMVKNKAAIEASIVNAYLLQETSFLATDYLGPEFKTNSRRMRRNEIHPQLMENEVISIYNYPGRGGAKLGRRKFSEIEFSKATHYILSQTPEVESYINIFQTELQMQYPSIGQSEMDQLTLTTFPNWLKDKIWTTERNENIPSWFRDLCMGFDWHVTCSATYKINNYKFHTELHSEGRRTTNCDVHVKGVDGIHYYGIIEEILEIKCRVNQHIRCVLFKCRWLDPEFVKSYSSTGIIEVNKNKLYQHYDPFILAQQAEQVYYTHFPGLPRKTRQGLVAVCRVKPTNTIDIKTVDCPFQDEGDQSSQMPQVNMVHLFDGLADESYNQYNNEDVNMIEEESSSSNYEEESEYEASSDDD